MVSTLRPHKRMLQGHVVERTLISEDKLMWFIVLANVHLVFNAFLLILFNSRMCDLLSMRLSK